MRLTYFQFSSNPVPEKSGRRLHTIPLKVAASAEGVKYAAVRGGRRGGAVQGHSTAFVICGGSCGPLSFRLRRIPMARWRGPALEQCPVELTKLEPECRKESAPIVEFVSGSHVAEF